MWGKAALVTSATSVILATGHLVSWTNQFPHQRAQLLWRICSLYLILGPFTFLPFTPLNPAGYGVFMFCWTRLTNPRLRTSDEKMKTRSLFEPSVMCLIFLIAVYVMARLLLIVLIIYSFFSLPADVYKTADNHWMDFLSFT